MPLPAALTSIPPIPRALGLLAAVACGLVLASALAGAAAAGLHRPPVWFMLGFELLIAFASVFGILTGLGRFGEAPGLALVCVAGVVGAGSLLGYLAGRENLAFDLRLALAGRELAAAAILAIAGLAVLLRRPREGFRRFALGAACAAALAATVAGLWFFRTPLLQLGTLAGAAVGLAATVLVLGLLAAAVHLLISAFEAGSLDEVAPSAS